MSELAIWLVAIAVSDLAHGPDRLNVWRRGVAVGVTVAAAIGAALLLGVGVWLSLFAVPALVWTTLWRAEHRLAPAFALGWLGLVTLATVLVATPVPADGIFGRLVVERTGGGPAGLSPATAAVLLGGSLALLATGNAVARAGLALARVEGFAPKQRDAEPLRGGRVIGSLERLLILGFAVAGELTAAALVISAKGLLRFNDLRTWRSPAMQDPPAAPERARSLEDAPAATPEHLSEYVLVGSLVSWTTALAVAALVALAP